MSKWTREDIVRVATEMYEDGTTESERYSDRAWKSRGWPEVDDKSIHKALGYYLKYMKHMDIYEGNELPKYVANTVVGKSDLWSKKT